MAFIPRKHVYFHIRNNCNGLQFVLLPRVFYNGKNNLRFAGAFYCSVAAVQAESEELTSASPRRISRAMESYLTRTKEYEQFIKEQNEAYIKGKKFLAKIMDEDFENFDQEKIDRAIEYLLPSGLFDKKAKPCFKSPELLFPKQKEAQFDHTGRPFHFLFYTTKPNFYEVLSECAEYSDKLNKKFLKLGPDVIPPKKSIVLTGTVWLSKKELEEKLLETILDAEYETFVESMNRLLEHPYSYEAADFILKYRESESKRKLQMTLPPKTELDNGQSLVIVERCAKKRCSATVKVLSPGTGKILINGKEIIDVFPDIRTRGQFPKSLLAISKDKKNHFMKL